MNEADTALLLKDIETIIREWRVFSEQIIGLDLHSDLEPVYNKALDRYNKVILNKIRGELYEYFEP